MVKIAQVLTLEFAEMLASRFNGFVQKEIINGEQIFIVFAEV